MTDWAYLKKDYKIREHVGSGSYGQVYRAKNRHTQ
jgi:serine/threonine protein kinase